MMIISVLVAAYAFYTLFSADEGVELGLSLVRVSAAICLAVAAHHQSEGAVAIAVLLNLASALVAMGVLRKEVQVKNDGA